MVASSKVRDLDFVVPMRMNAAWVDAYINFEICQEEDQKLPAAGLEISLISLKIHHKTTYRFNKGPEPMP